MTSGPTSRSARARVHESSSPGVDVLVSPRGAVGHLPAALDAEAIVASAKLWATHLARNLALQDWMLVVYVCGMLLALAFGTGPDRAKNARLVVADFALLATGLVLSRGQILRPGGWPAALVYRASTCGMIVLSYFQLKTILPSVSSRAFDAEIFDLDARLFGFEPSLAWDRFVSVPTTEWFAFFYFSHFILLALHVLPCLFVSSDGRLNARFALGAYFIFCTAHLIYMAVPGYGPYAHLSAQFQHALEGPTFWPLVLETVTASGAQKDIFPSVHTAIPVYCVAFAWIHRRQRPFGYVFAALLFWASQIVIATMFLRWHYLIDIVAGVCLALTAAVLAVRLERWEWARREALALPPVFPTLWTTPSWLRAKHPAGGER